MSRADSLVPAWGKQPAVTGDNVDAALKLASDQVSAIETFPFEKPLADIVATY